MIRRQQETVSLPDHLDIRLKSAYGLRLLPAFRQTLIRVQCGYERSLVTDDICAALMGIGRDTFFSVKARMKAHPERKRRWTIIPSKEIKEDEP